MTERPRPPGLERVAEEGLKLGARLAVGLLSVPLLGLSLLTSRQETRVPIEPEAPRADAAPGTVQDDPTLPEANANGPDRAEVEVALRKLTEASIGKPSHGKKGKPKRAASSLEAGRGRRARGPKASAARSDESRPS